MSGFNGRGPRGQGPFTGGGRGYCVEYADEHAMIARCGRGLGRRYGSGRGRGRGFGWGNVAEDANQSEAEFLQEQAKFLQNEIATINKRMDELENKK